MNFFKQHKWSIPVIILLVTLIWGYAWVLMKEGLQYMGPFTFSAFRFSIGTITMFIILWFLKISRPPKWAYKHLLVVGSLQTALMFLLVMYGLKFVEAGKSSVLLYSMPIWSTILAVLFLNEKVTKPKVIGLALGLMGLLTILGWDIWFNQNPGVILGEALIIISAIGWGASNVYYRKHLSQLNQMQTSAYQMGFGTLGIMLVTFIMEGGQPIEFTPYSIYLVIFTGVLASAFCFTVWFYILNLIDMVTATISTLLVPVFGLLLGWILIEETITWSIFIGSTLILIGIIISTKSKKPRMT
ncbi:DMT family transporter [Aquisalibacillus elongatus]|uniref:Drug/metabolite transporter (DMT)-like permease n=1 Tax=Aquisalibacillus elongatus TaxID=485577 RepID=A0A3N5BEE9_9BACI|nr:DMT family transporter [Aquisalibacillus elongatus]RPF55843.1 drug/metabolite transporter (DMT)-like permease [Aquisalibacillus elongatus]